MDSPLSQHLCGHVSHLEAVRQSIPIRCSAPAAYLVDGGIYRCADHLASALAGERGVEWQVVNLVDGVDGGRDVDAALAAAGIPCSIDRLQQWHATAAARVDTLAGQRNQLAAAMAWLDEPGRLDVLRSELERRRVEIEKDASGESVPNAAAYAAAVTPTVRQMIAELMINDPDRSQAAG